MHTEIKLVHVTRNGISVFAGDKLTNSCSLFVLNWGDNGSKNRLFGINMWMMRSDCVGKSGTWRMLRQSSLAKFWEGRWRYVSKKGWSWLTLTQMFLKAYLSSTPTLWLYCCVGRMVKDDQRICEAVYFWSQRSGSNKPTDQVSKWCWDWAPVSMSPRCCTFATLRASETQVSDHELVGDWGILGILGVQGVDSDM